MKKFKHLFAGIMLLSASSIVFAQSSKIKNGEKSYKKYNYSKAIESYEKASPKTTEIYRQLGESYYMLGSYDKAENYFAKVVSASDVKPQDYFRYAYFLRINQKYSESEKWFAKYSETEKNDSRLKEFESNKSTFDKLLKDENRYEISNLNINSAQQDFGTAYFNNHIVFASSREGVKSIVRRWNGNQLPYLNIYEAKANESGQLNEPMYFKAKVNKKFNEGPAAFSEDGKQIVWTKNNYKEKAKDGTSNLELYSAEMVNGEWKNEKSLPFNNKEYSVGQPSLSPDGNTLYFASNMPGGFGGTDIYKSEKQNGTWSKPENLGNSINTEGNEMFPFYHPSGLLFFSSDGHMGLGGLDIFIAQIKPNGFGKIKNLGMPMNTNNDDFAFTLNKEMKSGYFSSNRSGGKGSDDIYYYNLLKPFAFGKTIKGIVKDKSGNAVQDAMVKLMDDSGNEISKVISDENGSFSFSVDADKNFSLLGKKETYFDGTAKVSSTTEEDIVTANIEIEKDPGLSLYFLITEKISKTPIEGVKIKLLNNITGKDEIINTPSTGDFRKTLSQNKINDRVSFNIYMEKEGYLSKTVTFNKLLDKEGVYNVHKEMDLTLDKIAVGQDLAKIIDIKPIYFDLGKSPIRKDAGGELEKIVKLMNENPNMVVELGSHTDCRGTIAANEKLSTKRAEASAEYIKKKISNPSRISGKGYGESKLKNGCACEGAVKSTCTEAEHQENRRTEFIIIKL